MFLDLVPGGDNPPDLGTKQARSTAEFKRKVNVLSGQEPHLYMSAAVLKMRGAAAATAKSG